MLEVVLFVPGVLFLLLLLFQRVRQERDQITRASWFEHERFLRCEKIVYFLLFSFAKTSCWVFFFPFQRHFCKNAQKPQLFCMCMLIALLLVSPLHNTRRNYARNPAILLESSVSIKLLLWARNYCSIPKWRPQKYRKSYKGNCRANHLENKCRIGSQHAAHHIPKALEKMSN